MKLIDADSGETMRGEPSKMLVNYLDKYQVSHAYNDHGVWRRLAPHDRGLFVEERIVAVVQ